MCNTAYARTTDSDASWLAAESLTEESISEVQRAIIAVLLRERCSLTLVEIDTKVRAMLSERTFKDSTIRSRVNDLVKANIVRKSGLKRVPYARTKVTLYALYPDAYQQQQEGLF